MGTGSQGRRARRQQPAPRCGIKCLVPRMHVSTGRLGYTEQVLGRRPPASSRRQLLEAGACPPLLQTGSRSRRRPRPAQKPERSGPGPGPAAGQSARRGTSAASVWAVGDLAGTGGGGGSSAHDRPSFGLTPVPASRPGLPPRPVLPRYLLGIHYVWVPCQTGSVRPRLPEGFSSVGKTAVQQGG